LSPTKQPVGNPLVPPETIVKEVQNNIVLPSIKSNRSFLPSENQKLIPSISKAEVGRDDLLAENPIYNMLKNSPMY
jgi:hypothetical protein